MVRAYLNLYIYIFVLNKILFVLNKVALLVQNGAAKEEGEQADDSCGQQHLAVAEKLWNMYYGTLASITRVG